jgi:surface antigen
MAGKRTRTALKSIKSIVLLSILTILLPVWEGSNAYADPPPWAPAHGYRDKHKDKHGHGHGHDREDDDEDDGDHRGKRAYVIPSQPVYVVPYGIAQGTCNRKLLGQVLGGAAGAAIGSQIGQGNGKTLAMVGGGILGVIVGGNIGQSMDRVDQGCVGQILEHAPDHQTIAWTDPNNGGQYQVIPEKPYKTRDGRYCRTYLTNAVIDGYNRQVSGTACRQPNGIWQTAN